MYTTQNYFLHRLHDVSFNLQKFRRNFVDLDSIVISEIPSNDFAKVLGLLWKKSDDQAKINFNDLLSTTPKVPTNPQLLKFLASLYNPLGIMNPLFVKLKELFQNGCKENIEWNNLLTDDF